MCRKLPVGDDRNSVQTAVAQQLELRVELESEFIAVVDSGGELQVEAEVFEVKRGWGSIGRLPGRNGTDIANCLDGVFLADFQFSSLAVHRSEFTLKQGSCFGIRL